MTFDFDTLTDRRAARALKWQLMEEFTGAPDSDGLPMWVADMDFRSPDCAHRAAQDLVENSAYGYFERSKAYHGAIGWWMENRHGWKIEPEWILTAHGLGNGVAVMLQTFTEPGDGVIIFTPVYHEFASKIRKNGRSVVESPLVKGADGTYGMDLDALQSALTGNEKMVIFCSPHNPGGRVWSIGEQRELAEFCERNDLLLAVDEIHQDLVFPGHRHVTFPVAVPQLRDRLIMLTAASKTFNIAGCRTGMYIIPDDRLRKRLASALAALDIKPNVFGVAMTTAVYSAEGAEWVDALVAYLAENWRVFEAGLREIPGLKPMPMASTYLSWVDFADTGMEMSEVKRRVTKDARIGPSMGVPFGNGGESFLRFNIGTQRARIEEAVDRLQSAFSDLQ